VQLVHVQPNLPSICDCRSYIEITISDRLDVHRLSHYMAAIGVRTPRTRQPAERTAKPGRPARLAQRRVDEVARDGAARTSACIVRINEAASFSD
jgi:hypothetical protein